MFAVVLEFLLQYFISLFIIQSLEKFVVCRVVYVAFKRSYWFYKRILVLEVFLEEVKEQVACPAST